MQQLPPPGWYPEPSSPTGQRWWDGTQWTEQVHPPAPPTPETPSPTPSAAEDPAATGSATAGSASGAVPSWRISSMLMSPVVQISQQARVMESASTYALTDAGGGPVGQAAQVGQRRSGRLMKAMTDMDRNLAVTIQFSEPSGQPVMSLVKPGGVGPQRFSVVTPDGSQIGQINQKIRMVREAFDLVVGGQPAGALASENWIDRRFQALDASGAPFAVVHKRYEGYARAVFTSADEYVVEYATHATPDQRAIALASAIAMDIALYSR